MQNTKMRGNKGLYCMDDEVNKAGCSGGAADTDGERLEVERLILGSREANGTGGNRLR